MKDRITHFLADGCTQFNGMKRTERILCIVHLKRGQRRLFYRLSNEMSKSLFGTGKAARINKNLMSHRVIDRCAKELTRARKIYPIDKDFYTACEKIRNNITSCLSGSHDSCDKASLVCRPRRGRQIQASYSLTKKDKKLLQDVVDYRYDLLKCIK